MEALEAEVLKLRGWLDGAEERCDDLWWDVIYWQGAYGILRRILVHQHDDPAFEWLDQVTKLGAVRRSPAEVERMRLERQRHHLARGGRW